VTHRYTVLIRGTVISGRDEPDVTAIAWAADTVIALGSDDDVRGASRGDSHVIDLEGASVVALGDGPDAQWPPGATLEVGGRADLAVLESDPRLKHAHAKHRLSALALVRGGLVIAGRLPGEPRHGARRKVPLAGP
jgi:predicted amidohydrolase YtcJ